MDMLTTTYEHALIPTVIYNSRSQGNPNFEETRAHRGRDPDLTSYIPRTLDREMKEVTSTTCSDGDNDPRPRSSPEHALEINRRAHRCSCRLRSNTQDPHNPVITCY